jgi:two-component system, cell cycle sensor histidine kinase and response regulator CckA
MSQSKRSQSTLSSQTPELKAPLDCPIPRGVDAAFRVLFIENPQPMWVHDTKSLLFLEVNNAALERYGYSKAEFLQMLLTDIRYPKDSSSSEEKINEVGSSGFGHRLKDGNVIEVEEIIYGLVFRGHEAQLTVLQDITPSRLEQQSLKESEHKYRRLFEEATVGLYECSPEGRVLNANPAMAALCGFVSTDELTATADLRTKLHIEPSRLAELRKALREHGMVRRFEAEVSRKDGSRVWLRTNLQAVCEDEVVVRYEGSCEDITRYKTEENKFIETQQKFGEMVENAVIGIFQGTPEGSYTTVNPAMARLLGYDSPQDLIESIADYTEQVYVDYASREEFRRLAKKQAVSTNFESEAYRKDGTKVWLCTNAWAISKEGVVVRFEGTCEDVTRRKLLENELRQAHKMEAIGQLASGVAHDFNNALGVIIGYSDLLRMNLPEGDISLSHVEQIAKAGRRAAALIRQLLAFSRKQVIRPIMLDLNEATSEFEKMIRRLISENVEITFRRSPDLGWVNMDPGQVEQILMNLSINARDAMPEGGMLCVETANVEIDETCAHQNVYVTPGSYVMLSVSDTGCGMDNETLRHIFEPFFTTKDPGKGTGMGLSTVYGIAKQNSGFVRAYSDLGMGSTFRVYLPRVENSLRPASPFVPPEMTPTGTESILVVEDELSLRSLIRTCLETNGYLVIDSPNAVAALHLAKKHHGRIHLLLTDVIMPGMSGRELAHRLNSQRGIKVLYMSGYTNALIDQHGVLDPNTVLLEKPFTLYSLLAKVYEVLHTAERREGGARHIRFTTFGRN